MADEQPDLFDLVTELQPVADKWRLIGFEMSLEECDVDSIQEKNDFKSLKAVLSKVIERKKFTWGDIIDALQSPSMSEFELATELAQKYDESKCYEEDPQLSTTEEPGLPLPSESDPPRVKKPTWGDRLKKFPGEVYNAVKKVIIPEKETKMLLIGETGSGKTSFLNLLSNCAKVQELGRGFGPEAIDQIQDFHKIELENARAQQMESKTSDATLYNVQMGKLKLGVIDTPGFGDSRGFEQDKQNAQKIIDVVKKQEYINCVCLIINGRLSRASASLKYVLTEVAAILPKEILDNVIVVFSNTADSLDLNFDTKVLTRYFGKKLDITFYMENPYCRLEKAKSKSKAGIISDKDAATSLMRAFGSTNRVLKDIKEAIEKFEPVHTYQFIKLYEAKKRIEKNVLESLTAYDNQMRLEKALEDSKEEVNAAVKSKTLNKDWRSEQRFKKWKTIPTSSHNTLCGYKGCHSNCHEPCYLPKSLDKEVFKNCRCMGGGTSCRKCHHDYTYHYHEEVIFKEEEEVEPLIDEEMKKKFEDAKSDEERAQLIFQKLEKDTKASKAKRRTLATKLSKDIAEFERLGAARSYAKLIENQLAVIETHLQGTIGPESDDLRKTKDELEKELKVIRDAESII